MAGVCSHLQAWVFAAIDDEAQAAKFYTFAAVYALPLIRNGFHFDSFLVAAVLICAAHVQVVCCPVLYSLCAQAATTPTVYVMATKIYIMTHGDYTGRAYCKHRACEH